MRLNIINRDKGFTIVELLVVIVVIGILATITMVSYSDVTTKAKLAANKSNAASVMQAADAYFAEFGTYPTIGTQLNSGGSVKVPASVSGLITASAPASTAPSSITYIQAATGYCIEYWDTVTTDKATLATAGTGATCL